MNTEDIEKTEEFDVPLKPINPLTPQRLQSMKDEADKKLMKMYEAMVSASAQKKE